MANEQSNLLQTLFHNQRHWYGWYGRDPYLLCDLLMTFGHKLSFHWNSIRVKCYQVLLNRDSRSYYQTWAISR